MKRQDLAPGWEDGRRPLFVSAPAADRFWRAYRVYVDRVELETVLGVMSIPFDDINQVAALGGDSPPEGEAGEALVIRRNQGWLRQVCIRPREPDAFRRALEAALALHRQGTKEH